MLGGSPTGTKPERFTACRPFELTSGLYHTFLVLSSVIFGFRHLSTLSRGSASFRRCPLDSLKYITRFCGCQSLFKKIFSFRPSPLLPLIMYRAGVCRGMGGCEFVAFTTVSMVLWWCSSGMGCDIFITLSGVAAVYE